jgi:small neutral amino acid transporter SnatA (MarC family)
MILLTTFINFFFLLTPFFVLLLYLNICKNMSFKERHKIANKTCFYILTICLTILFFGIIKHYISFKKVKNEEAY